MAVAVECEADRGVAGPGGDFLRGGARGDPKRNRRVAKVVDAKPSEPGRVGGRPPDTIAEGDDAQGATLWRGEDVIVRVPAARQVRLEFARDDAPNKN
jgi:hypothetical protein